MNKYWIYCEPVSATSSEPVWTIMGDYAIIDFYWDYWCEQMEAANASKGLPLETGINPKACIEDWAVVHWALPVTQEVLQQFLAAPNLENFNGF